MERTGLWQKEVYNCVPCESDRRRRRKSGYVLQMEHITKSYQDGADKNAVLHDVSLKIKCGEFVAIVGPSGLGKSTFLTIARMLLSPDSGTVLIAGKNVSDAKKREWTKIR